MEAPNSTQFVGVSRRYDGGALLRLGPEPLSVAWSNPSRGVWVVGLGVCAEGGGPVSCDVELPAGPWFGGWAFDAQRGWAGFDAERWVLPEVLAFWNGRFTTLVGFGTDAESIQRRLDRVLEVEPASARTPMVRRPEPRAAYESLVARALRDIPSTASKLVVARPIEVVGDASERLVLKALEARNPACWTFLVRGRDGSAFVGSTPELLCDVDGAVLETEALAGTAGVGEGVALLRSEKDRREHQAVVDDLRARLDAVVTQLSLTPEPQLKALASLVHLHTPIRGQLRAGIAALEVARALHPTPAVAGAPRDAATAWLAANEGFSRGWYSGVVGAVGPTRSTFAVGIRSAHLRSGSATVYVGAGVVEGSSPEAEWAETERKAETMLMALGVEHG